MQDNNIIMGELFTNNYNELYIVAKRITQRKDYRMAPALINETYIQLQHKIPPKCPNEFVKWFSKSMKQQYFWKETSYNKNERITSIDTGIDIPDTENFNLSIEDTNQQTKELIEINSGMKTERMLKYIQVLEFKENLLLHEKYLFELHFTNGLSGREIARNLNMSKNSIILMINKIKTKLKQYKWK